MKEYVTVIIPAFNEENNIGNVITKSKKCEHVNEIIVVNNLSTDNTEKVAVEAGAKVINCNKQGKGYAMEEGIKYAKNNIIVFLDADIPDYKEEIIEIMAEPILKRNVQFVKSNFDRENGRVTNLVARPLLKLLMPDIQEFSQPLSGMIAGTKEAFENIEFEKDYGVDIGILLDMLKKKVSIEEVYIGSIRNVSKDWRALEKMSTEVMKAILKRANK